MVTGKMNRAAIFENVIKCKWTVLILDRISRGIKQPGKLKRSIPGLTKKVMYQRLKKLERFQIINRRLVTEKPLKVYYSLTLLGKKTIRIIKMIHSL